MQQARSQSEGSRPQARSAGRGFLIISGAKVWFLVSASVLNFGLPLLLDTPADYGVYGVVVGAVSLLNMVVITGGLQAVSKLVSEHPDAAGAVVRRACVLQLALGLPLAAGFALTADPLADWLRDPAYAPLLRVSAIIVAAYSFYALFVGAFNGLEAFTRQAALDIVFATLRTGLILGAVAAGLGVAGAIGGFSLASVVITLVAMLALARFLARRPVRDTQAGPPAVDGRRLLTFLISIMVYTFVLNALMRVDLFVLKRASAGLAGAPEVAAAASNALTGAYNLVVNIARLPYQAVIAVTFVIFPMLSRSTFEQDREATRAYIATTMRYSLLLIGALVTVFAGAGDDLLRPLYPDFAYAGSALPWLCVAYGLFALLYVSTTMLIAAGHPWHSTALMTLTTGLLATLCTVWLGALEIGPGMLDAAAIAVLVTMFVGVVAAAWLCLRSYGAFLPLKSAVRLLVVIGGLIALGQLTAFDRWIDFADPLPTLTSESIGQARRGMLGSRSMWLAAAAGKALALGVLYLVAVVASGEIGPQDRERVRSVLARRRGGAPPSPVTLDSREGADHVPES